MKILIAEDNRAAQLTLQTVLADLGHEPLVTGNGRTACEIMLKPDAPQLAILDWMMPGLDGVEVCRKIRAAKISAPAYLILLTVLNKTDNIVMGLKAGANDYITKPYNIEELQVRVGVGCRVMEMQAIMAKQIKDLQTAMEQIKTLRGLLPICSYCKNIRVNEEYWQQVEAYLSEHSEVMFSHGVCPKCYQKYLQPELEKCLKKTTVK